MYPYVIRHTHIYLSVDIYTCVRMWALVNLSVTAVPVYLYTDMFYILNAISGHSPHGSSYRGGEAFSS